MRSFGFDFLLYVSNHLISKMPSHALRILFYRYALNCKIGEGSHIFMGAIFDARGHFEIGVNSTINQKCRLDNRDIIIIGNNVSISSEVCILTADHDIQDKSFSGRTRPVTIEDYVFIGTRAMILPGVILGTGSVVAAGSVVTKNVESYTIVAGVPARPIGHRRDDLEYSVRYKRFLA